MDATEVVHLYCNEHRPSSPMPFAISDTPRRIGQLNLKCTWTESMLEEAPVNKCLPSPACSLFENRKMSDQPHRVDTKMYSVYPPDRADLSPGESPHNSVEHGVVPSRVGQPRWPPVWPPVWPTVWPTAKAMTNHIWPMAKNDNDI